MPMPYRVEFFDRDFTYQGQSVISAPALEYDYLTLDASKITLPGSVTVLRSWYALIKQNGTVFSGVVTATESDGRTTTVSIAPLVSLFSFPFVKAPTAYTGGIEAYIAGILRDNLVTTVDTVERIPGLTVTAATTTTGVPLPLEGYIHDFWADIAIPALEGGQIVIGAALDVQNHEIECVIAKAPTAPVKINADQKGIIDKSFSFRDDYGEINKVIVINKDTPTQTATYYAADYAAPTVRKVVEISLSSGDVWATKAKEAADKELERKAFDNSIELKFADGYKLIPAVEIGQKVDVYHAGRVYTSFLTGIKRAGGITTLTCGSVRLDLTKILKMEGK